MTRERFIKESKHTSKRKVVGILYNTITRYEEHMKANEEEISRHFNECEKHEAQLKAKDDEIERLKEIINASIEEIEYALIKPQYAEVYLNNAIRFLKDNA